MKIIPTQQDITTFYCTLSVLASITELVIVALATEFGVKKNNDNKTRISSMSIFIAIHILKKKENMLVALG